MGLGRIVPRAGQNAGRSPKPVSTCYALKRLLIRASHKPGRVNYMANTPGKDHRISDEEALRIAEQTDVSPRQAKELVKEHGKAKGTEEARKQKDES